MLIQGPRKILLLVSQLHHSGYQKIRISPGLSPSGAYWRCSIGSALHFTQEHGAMLSSDNRHCAHFSSAESESYFGWKDALAATVSEFAEMFIERFPETAREGHGIDLPYAVWFQEMLALTEPDGLPIAYCDWELPENSLVAYQGSQQILIPLPPPGEARQPVSIKR